MSDDMTTDLGEIHRTVHYRILDTATAWQVAEMIRDLDNIDKLYPYVSVHTYVGEDAPKGLYVRFPQHPSDRWMDRWGMYVREVEVYDGL